MHVHAAILLCFTCPLGTVMVKDLHPGAPSSDPSWMTVFNGYLYFTASGVDVTWMLQWQLTDELMNQKWGTVLRTLGR